MQQVHVSSSRPRFHDVRRPALPATTRIVVESLRGGHAQRFLRFGVVGASGVVVNMVLMYFLVEMGHVNQLVAAALASEASILSNFALNDRWTFRDARPTTSWPRRAVQYNAVALSGMVISLGILALLMASHQMHYLVANFLAIGASTLSNYLLNSRFTWATRRLSAPGASLAPVADW